MVEKNSVNSEGEPSGTVESEEWFDASDVEAFTVDELPETISPNWSGNKRTPSSFDELPPPKYSLGFDSNTTGSENEITVSKPKYSQKVYKQRKVKPVRDWDENPADPEEVKTFNKQAENFIVWHLSQRDLTVHEATQKLVKKQKWPEETIQYVIEKCINNHWLDDEKFVENYIRSEQRWNQLCKYAIKMKLLKKGAPSDIVETYLNEIDSETETESAKELLIKQVQKINHLPDDKKTQRLLGLLARKGYPASIAYPLVKEIVGNPDITLDEWESL
jgi:SOS response regulatory protein OraA/RecX